MGDFIAKHASPKKAVLMEGRTTDDAPKRFQAKLLSYLYNCQAALLWYYSKSRSWLLTFLKSTGLLGVDGRIGGTWTPNQLPQVYLPNLDAFWRESVSYLASLKDYISTEMQRHDEHAGSMSSKIIFAVRFCSCLITKKALLSCFQCLKYHHICCSVSSRLPKALLLHKQGLRKIRFSRSLGQ